MAWFSTSISSEPPAATCINMCAVCMWHFSHSWWPQPSHSNSSSFMTNGSVHSNKFIFWLSFLYASSYTSFPTKTFPDYPGFPPIFQKPDPIHLSLMLPGGSSEFLWCYCWQHSFDIYYSLSRIIRYILVLNVFFSYLSVKFLKSMNHELYIVVAPQCLVH